MRALSQKQQNLHKRIRNSMRTNLTEETRFKFMLTHASSKSDILPLVRQISTMLNNSFSIYSHLSLLHQILNSHEFPQSPSTAEQTATILTETCKLLLRIFAGQKSNESVLALLCLFNCMTDMQSAGLVKLKLQFIQYFFELFEEQKAKRGKFEPKEMQELQFIFSNFLMCNYTMMEQEHVKKVLEGLKEETRNEELVGAILEALEKFVMDTAYCKKYSNELYSYYEMCVFHLKIDYPTETTYRLLLIINILLDILPQQLQQQQLQNIIYSSFKHYISGSSKIKTMVYRNITQALKKDSYLYKIITKNLLPKILEALKIQSFKIKVEILKMFEELLKLGEERIVQKLQSSGFFQIVLFQMAEIDHFDITLMGLKVIQEGLCSFGELKGQVAFVKMLKKSRGMEALDKVEAKGEREFDVMVEEIRTVLDEIEMMAENSRMESNQ